MAKMMAEITAKLVGKKFKHNSSDPEVGLDCFTNVMEFLKMKGKEVNKGEKFKGFDIFNYEAIYGEDPHGTMELAVEYLSTILEEVKIGFEVAGDILAIRFRLTPSAPLGLAIDAGNGFLIIAVQDLDIKLVPKKHYRIIKAYRMVKES